LTLSGPLFIPRCLMPIYEYQCDECAAVFEVFQKHTDPAPEQHSCGSRQIRRLLSNTSFVLKGTGWYATDYGNRKDGDAAAKKRDRASSGESSSEGKSTEPAKSGDSGGKSGSSAGTADSSKASGATDSKTKDKGGKAAS
jgi:putative FmdB family regulatory protein